MNERNDEAFWNASIEEIKRGYIEDEEKITCLVCGEVFIRGRIYEIDGYLYDFRKAVEIHTMEKHNSMFEYILNMNSSFTGISESQKAIVQLIAEGLTDKEIADKLDVANSTIRNHRYKLREKEKQAKLFLTMMELLAKGTNKKISKLDKDSICDAHKTATTLDDRFNITTDEKEKVVKAYFDETGALKNFPSKEKKKIIVLEQIMKNFKIGNKYSEKEINKILKRIFDDYVTIRRYLIEYGFLDRSKDCSEYWVKE